jgi:hypothetical protein
MKNDWKPVFEVLQPPTWYKGKQRMVGSLNKKEPPAAGQQGYSHLLCNN